MIRLYATSRPAFRSSLMSGFSFPGGGNIYYMQPEITSRNDSVPGRQGILSGGLLYAVGAVRYTRR